MRIKLLSNNLGRISLPALISDYPLAMRREQLEVSLAIKLTELLLAGSALCGVFFFINGGALLPPNMAPGKAASSLVSSLGAEITSLEQDLRGSTTLKINQSRQQQDQQGRDLIAGG